MQQLIRPVAADPVFLIHQGEFQPVARRGHQHDRIIVVGRTVEIGDGHLFPQTARLGVDFVVLHHDEAVEKAMAPGMDDQS